MGEYKRNLEVSSILKYPFSMLSKMGLYSKNKYNVSILATFYALFPLFLIIVALMQFKNIKFDIFEIVNNLEELSEALQLLGKIVIMAYQQKYFIQLIDKTKLFWSAEDCDELTKSELNRTKSITLGIQKSFFPISFCTVIIMIISPLFGKPLPLGIWNMEGYDILYSFVLGAQIITLPFAVFLVCHFDCSFLGFCTEIMLQFRILCYNLKNLKMEENETNGNEIKYFKNLKSCVEQHIFLLSFIKEFQQAYSSAILTEYFTVSPLICLGLYATFESNHIQLRLRYFLTWFAQLMQLALYCIPVHYMTREALKVSDSTSQSEWYIQYFPPAKTPLLLMIQNSQREIVFTAAGLIIINAATVLDVVKVAWSVCAVMRGLK